MVSADDCDLCWQTLTACPGQAVHCARGEHCVTTTEVCARDQANDDHPRQCEDCAAVLADQ